MAQLLALLVSVLLFVSCASDVWSKEVTTLAWDVPTTNEDGSVLDDLAGYRVYCGQSSATYLYVIDVGNVTTQLIENVTALDDGMYYCAVTAYDVWQNESVYSNEVEMLRRGAKFYSRDTIKPSKLFLQLK